MRQTGRLAPLSAVPQVDRRSEEGAELQGEAFCLPAHLRSSPHLWSYVTYGVIEKGVHRLADRSSD